MKSLFGGIIPVVAALVLGQGEPKSPPDAAGQQAALKVIRDTFKAEYSKRGAQDRIALAKLLLKQAPETKDDAASVFVLLTEARDVAAEAGAAEVSMQAVDALARDFKIDAVEVRAGALATLEKSAKTPEDLKVVANYRLRLAEEALAADNVDAAAAASASAAALGRKAKELVLITRAEAFGKEIAARKAALQSVKKAQETLKEKPDDPAASGVLGRYTCFLKGDWAAGLPLLAKSQDPVLKDAAEKDLATPAAPADQLAIGDAWWSLGEKEKDGRPALRRRAIHWYAQAAPQLTGLSKARAEKRIIDVRLEQFARGTWVDVADPKAFGQPGKPGDPITLKPEDRFEMGTAEYPVVGDFDGFSVRVRFEPADPRRKVQIRYASGKLQHTILISPSLFWTLTNPEGAENQQKIDFTSKIDDRPERVITVLASGDSYLIFLDGEERGRHPLSPGRLLKLRLETVKAPTTFDQIRLHKKE